MQEALPYKRWKPLPSMVITSPSPPPTTTTSGGEDGGGGEFTAVVIESLVKENPVIVFGKRGCYMCHVVRKLLIGLGVNPPMFEIDDDINEALVVKSLSQILHQRPPQLPPQRVADLQFPVVFVGGKLFGGLEKVIATHLSGELVAILKQAGALWL